MIAGIAIGAAAAFAAANATVIAAHTHVQHALSAAPDGVQRFAALCVSAEQNHNRSREEARCPLDSAQSAAPQKRGFSWLRVF